MKLNDLIQAARNLNDMFFPPIDTDTTDKEQLTAGIIDMCKELDNGDVRDVNWNTAQTLKELGIELPWESRINYVDKG